MTLIQQFLRPFNTLAGRLAFVLTVGITFTAIFSLVAADHYRFREFSRYRANRITMSATDIAMRLENDPKNTRAALANDQILGASIVTAPRVSGTRDGDLDAMLAKRFPASAQAFGLRVAPQVCKTKRNPPLSHEPAGFVFVEPECWIISFITSPSHRISIGLVMPPEPPSASYGLKSAFMFLAVIIAALISAMVASRTLRFMRKLTEGARRFAQDIDAGPIIERGPSDVVETFAAFNLMQERVRSAMRERTHILAAISHDLQTPLTRLRLRAEAIERPEIRMKVIADIVAMERLVGEGLALAKSHESIDDWALVDLGSLLSSVVEDANDGGKDVSLFPPEPINLRVRPDALTRCLQNLIDNAVAYGSRATVKCHLSAGKVIIQVRDFGPGLKDRDLERMFEPFVRGETSRSRATGGTGIGLTIARAQARTFNASVLLENHPERGLVASIAILQT